MKKITAVRIALIVLGSVLLLNAAVLFLTSRSNFGVVPLSVFAAALILYGVFLCRLKKQKWLHAVMACGSAALVIFSAFLALYGSNDTAQYDEDVVIILGSGVRGEEVTPNLAKRLDKAAEYYVGNPDAVFIVSGGQGNGEAISEALAMERYLVNKGLPVQQIIKEDNSTSTYENFTNSLQIAEKDFPQGFSAVFVTSHFHIYRAQRLAKTLGIDATHLGADIIWYSIPMNYMREMLAVLKTLVVGF